VTEETQTLDPQSARNTSAVQSTRLPISRGEVLSALLLVAAALVVYWPATRGGYVWDDNLHLLDNPVLKSGGLAKTWVPGTYINYWPLTFSTYWLEDKLWGVSHPAGFHLVNILLHVGCALLLWQVLRQVFSARAHSSTNWWWGPLFGAAIFALHPVNVESVAWVTQLKNVLSLFLTLCALWLYLHHERTGRWQSYVLAVCVFALSTLAKGMGVTLPAVLLALAWWQRGRIEWRDVRRVLPFLIIGGVMAYVEVAMQKEGQPWEVPRTDGLLSRVAAAGWCVWFYLYKLVWPLNLSFVYPRWTVDSGKLLSFAPDVFLIGALVVAWLRRRTWGRGLFMLLSCYVALLFPVLGFANIYFMRYSLVADHWQYAAMIVPAAALGVWLASAARGRTSQVVVGATTATMLVCLGALTFVRAGTYKDEETLWQDVLARNPGSWMAHHNLANFLANHGRAQEAVVRYESAVRLKSDDFQAFNNLGVMLSRLGRSEDAIVNFERALAIRGDYDRARQNLIPEYRRLGDQSLIGVRDYNTARRSYLRLTQLTPSDAVAHYGLSVALIETGDVPQAAKELQTAVTLNPTFLAAYDLLARTLATRTPADGGNPDLALKAALQACALTSYSDPSRLDTLAMAYASADRFSTALATEQRALDLVRRSGSRDLLETLQAHSNLFRAGKPYREP
jgi:tetratricopeptide (TPR) repeat protein